MRPPGLAIAPRQPRDGPKVLKTPEMVETTGRAQSVSSTAAPETPEPHARAFDAGAIRALEVGLVDFEVGLQAGVRSH